MRILVITAWFPTRDVPSRTPFIARHVTAIARDHRVHVIHVQLLGRAGPRFENYDGHPVTRVGFDPRAPLSVLRTVREIRRWAKHCNVVHTMAFSSALVTALAVVGRPWVHTEHWNGVLFPEHVNTLWQRFAWLRHVLKLPRTVTGVSSLMTEQLREFARPGSTRILGNVVEHAENVPPRTTDSRVRLIGIGAVTHHKGVLLAVETVAWLRAQGHRATLVWAGEGPQKEEAQQRARELGVENFVEFPGFLRAAHLWEAIERADVFLLPSKSETFCVAAAEALAAGKPVVMGDMGGQRDFITERNGRMVAERTAPSFGQAVVEVRFGREMGTPEELAGDIRDRYGWDSVSQQLSELYRDAVVNPQAATTPRRPRGPATGSY